MRTHFGTESVIVGEWEILPRPIGLTIRTEAQFHKDLFPNGQAHIDLDFAIEHKPLTEDGREISMFVHGHYLAFKLPQKNVRVDFHRQLYLDWLWPEEVGSDMEVHHKIRVEGQRHKSDNLLASLALISAAEHQQITAREREADRQCLAELQAARDEEAEASSLPSCTKKCWSDGRSLSRKQKQTKSQPANLQVNNASEVSNLANH